MKYRASKLTLKEVSKEEEKDFLNKYHYQGFVSSLFCYGLYDKDELIELMSFGRPRYNFKYDWELLRLCTKKDCQVYGGASKLYKARPTGTMVSYCNESKFTGKVYESLGMLKRNVCHSYHYEKDGKTFHRSGFQKWKLIKKYPQYKDLTEKEITQILGYKRVEEKQATWVSQDSYKYYIYKIEIGKYSYIGQHAYLPGKEDDDTYMGSGSILKRIQKKYNTLGTKKILIDNLSREEADKFEICAIATDKIVNSNNINIQKGGQNYKTHHCGSSGSSSTWSKGHTPWNKGKKMSEDWLSKHRTTEYRQRLSEARKGREPWNKGKHYTIHRVTEKRWTDQIPEGYVTISQKCKELNTYPYYIKRVFDVEYRIIANQKIGLIRKDASPKEFVRKQVRERTPEMNLHNSLRQRYKKYSSAEDLFNSLPEEKKRLTSIEEISLRYYS